MRDADLTAIKDVLTAMKRDERREGERPSDYFLVKAEAFRKAVSSRLKATDMLASIVRPASPTFARLDKPFLIWALRNGGAAGDMLKETHIEPLNSWARFFSSWESSGEEIGPHHEVAFYFFWQNDSGEDTVVNVETQLMLAGRADVFAESGLIWTPFWGTGTIGRGRLRLDARLQILEWWNQPPTQPLAQPSQQRDVIDWSVSGGWAPLGSGNGKSQWLSGSYHLNYDAFLVPRDAVVVFEVMLNIYYGGYKGSGTVDFQTASESLLCPYVLLEGLTAPLTVSG